MSLLVAFSVTYIAISLMFVAKPKRLATITKYPFTVPLSGRELHGVAWCMFALGVTLVSTQHGWETGVPIWLSLFMIAGVLVVTLFSLHPKSWGAVLMLNGVIVVIALLIWLSA